MIEQIYQLIINLVNFFARVDVQYPTSPRDIWIHASSVGEINTIAYLVNLFIEHHISLFITTFTKTGQERAKILWKESVEVSRFPYDKKSEIENLVRIVQPKALIITETELWPNLILTTKGIPKFLINARISEKSFPRYRKFKKHISMMLNQFELILAQSEIDSERFIELGAPPERVKVIGSLKYDAVKRPYKVVSREFHGYRKDDIIIIFGSIRTKEEDAVIRTIDKLRKEFENVQFIIAPRHLIRKEFIVAKLKTRGIPYILRSTRGKFYRDKVLVLDTLGELFDFYHIADIAFVGGTLANYGGHSLIEPAYVGIPVIMGPYYSNIKEAGELLKEFGGAKEVHTEDELLQTLRELIQDEEKRKEMGRKALEAIESKTGASEKTFNLILNKIKLID